MSGKNPFLGFGFFSPFITFIRASIGSDASLDLNFAKNLSLVDDISGTNLITFTRASSGTYVDASGVIQTAADNVPRFDHDPVTGQSLGLLIEEERKNYAPQSENPSVWAATNGATKETFTAVTAPDGSTITQGFRLPDGGARVYPTVSAPGTIDPVASIYVRAVSGTATLSLFIQGGVVETGVSVPSDKWVRLSGVGNPGTNVTAFSVRGNSSQSEDVYLWGAQLEEGSFPTSYIPTSGSTATRTPDLVSIEGTNFTSWYNPTAGTFYVQENSSNNGLDKYYVYVSSGANSDRLWLSKDSINRHVFRVYDSTNTLQVVSVSPSLPSSSELVSSKFAGAYFSGDSNAALDGSILGAGLNNTFVRSGSNSVYLGSNSSGSSSLNGHMARLTYFSTRNIDQELIDLTT